MKCIYCNADMIEGSNRCEYCGKEQNYNEVVSNNTEPVNNEPTNNMEYPQQQPYNMQPDNQNYYYPIARKNKSILIILAITIIVCIISCFLPFFSVLGFTQNYVMSGEKVLDGIFIIAFGIISLLLLVFKKRIPVLIFQILSNAVFFYDYFNIKSKDTYGIASHIFGIGFYLLFIFLIVSLVLSIVRIVAKNNFE